jgi:hypothetical protein
VSRIVGEVFALNVALALLAMLSIQLDSAAASLVLLLVGASAVAWQLYRFSHRRGR